MSKIQLAVFDMAGTTVNEDNVVYKTVQKVLSMLVMTSPWMKFLSTVPAKRNIRP